MEILAIAPTISLLLNLINQNFVISPAQEIKIRTVAGKKMSPSIQVVASII